MRFERLDLNLLVALSVLIEERSVSAAAKRLHLSQPAVSGALNRLREFFCDELLVQSGRQMVLTAKAEELAGPVQDALLLIRTRITTPARFDPATADRTFRVIASDYVFSVFLADAFAAIAGLAPHVRFEMSQPDARTPDLLERGEADLLLLIDVHTRPDFPRELIFEDVYSVVCWSESAYAAGVDRASFSAAGHVASYLGPTRTQAASETYFEQNNVARKVEVWLPSFTMLPQAVIGTDRLATVQRRFAERCACSMPITVLPMPFELPVIHEVAQWHSMREADAGLRWLVATLKARAALL